MKTGEPPHTSRILARLVGWLVAAVCVSLLLSVIAFAYAYASLLLARPSQVPLMRDMQRALYFNGLRHIWQTQSDCVAFDPVLTYVPKPGACRFANPEFDTVLNFTTAGRRIEYATPPRGRAILVLGDSHAMGWGVADRETFAQVIADLTHRPVFNLAVSSYGTLRELQRAVAFPAFPDADTIVIQYCDNDLYENERPPEKDQARMRASFELLVKSAATTSYVDRAALLWMQYSNMLDVIRSRITDHGQTEAESFSSHYTHLIAQLARYPALRDKRVIIFYANGHNATFPDFPHGYDRQLPNVLFFQPELADADFYRIDDHLNARGHRKIGVALSEIILDPGSALRSHAASWVPPR